MITGNLFNLETSIVLFQYIYFFTNIKVIVLSYGSNILLS